MSTIKELEARIAQLEEAVKKLQTPYNLTKDSPSWYQYTRLIGRGMCYNRYVKLDKAGLPINYSENPATKRDSYDFWEYASNKRYNISIAVRLINPNHGLHKIFQMDLPLRKFDWSDKKKKQDVSGLNERIIENLKAKANRYDENNCWDATNLILTDELVDQTRLLLPGYTRQQVEIIAKETAFAIAGGFDYLADTLGYRNEIRPFSQEEIAECLGYIQNVLLNGQMVTMITARDDKLNVDAGKNILIEFVSASVWYTDEHGNKTRAPHIAELREDGSIVLTTEGTTYLLPKDAPIRRDTRYEV